MSKLLVLIFASMTVFSSSAQAGGLVDKLAKLGPKPSCQATEGGFDQMNACAIADGKSACRDVGGCSWTKSRLSCENVEVEEVEIVDCSLNRTPDECDAPSLRRFCLWK